MKLISESLVQGETLDPQHLTRLKSAQSAQTRVRHIDDRRHWRRREWEKKSHPLKRNAEQVSDQDFHCHSGKRLATLAQIERKEKTGPTRAGGQNVERNEKIKYGKEIDRAERGAFGNICETNFKQEEDRTEQGTLPTAIAPLACDIFGRFSDVDTP